MGGGCEVERRQCTVRRSYGMNDQQRHQLTFTQGADYQRATRSSCGWRNLNAWLVLVAACPSACTPISIAMYVARVDSAGYRRYELAAERSERRKRPNLSIDRTCRHCKANHSSPAQQTRGRELPLQSSPQHCSSHICAVCVAAGTEHAVVFKRDGGKPGGGTLWL